MKRPTRECRWWWWGATLTISFLFGGTVLIAVDRGLRSATLASFFFLISAGLMAGIGVQRSFRWVTTWYRRELKPQEPRSVLVKAGGAACLIVGGLLVGVAMWMILSFEETHPSFLWRLVSGGVEKLIVLPGLELIAVGLRLFKGKWPGQGFWSG